MAIQVPILSSTTPPIPDLLVRVISCDMTNDGGRTFCMKPYAMMDELMWKYSRVYGIELTDLSLEFHGKQVNHDDTPETLSLTQNSFVIACNKNRCMVSHDLLLQVAKATDEVLTRITTSHS